MNHRSTFVVVAVHNGIGTVFMREKVSTKRLFCKGQLNDTGPQLINYSDVKLSYMLKMNGSANCRDGAVMIDFNEPYNRQVLLPNNIDTIWCV